jgi:F-type H+-transporting ATPase subunit b
MGEETVLTVAQATTETPTPSTTGDTAPEAPAATDMPTPSTTGDAAADAPAAAEAAEGESPEGEGEGLIDTIIDAVTDVVEDVVPGGDDEAAGEAEGQATGEAVGVADDHGAGAEDHGPFGPELWLVLALLALIMIAFRPAKRAILGALDQRAGRIRDELDEAKRLHEEAHAALANFQRRQRDALGEAGEIIAHAQVEAERLREHAVAELEETLKRREAMAMDRIAQAEAAATAEVRSVVVDVAIAAARDVIGAQLDKTKADALVDDAIKDLPNRLH